MNTTKKGQVRSIVFKEGATWYGVALEFNIVVDGIDAEVVQFNLQEAIRGYVESQRKIKGARMNPLNQKPDAEYEHMWKIVSSRQSIPSPIQIKYFGVTCV